MERVSVDAGNEAEAAAHAAQVLAEGGVVVFPAERLYGLAADATNERAVARVFELKGRSRAVPLPVIVEDERAAGKWVEISGPARALMKKFWPGPLTLVLPVKTRPPRPLFTGAASLGIRAPGNAIARAVAQKLGSPVTATSANQSGRASGRTTDEALAGLTGEPDLVLDTGALAGPPGSTVVRFVADGLEILRPGVIRREALEQELQKVKKT